LEVVHSRLGEPVFLSAVYPISDSNAGKKCDAVTEEIGHLAKLPEHQDIMTGHGRNTSRQLKRRSLTETFKLLNSFSIAFEGVGSLMVNWY
jgi:hypothetical protein